MAGVVKCCKKCREEMVRPFFGYYPFMDENAQCNKHGVMKNVNISNEEYITITDIAPRNVEFLEAMIDLKQKDIIEYELKMSQFKAQQAQAKAVEEDNTPKCPHCKSANIKKMGGVERGASIAMWGIFSKKINKTFKCGNCGYMW